MPASDFDAHFPRRSPDQDDLTVSCAIHVDGKYLTQKRPGGPKADGHAVRRRARKLDEAIEELRHCSVVVSMS